MAGPAAPGRGLRGTAHRLGPGLTALAILDVVLVLGALTVLGLLLAGVLGPSSSTTAPPSSSASPSVEEGETSPAVPTAGSTPPVGALDLTEFASPSHNIICRIMADAVSCTIASFSYPAPTPTAACEDGTVGHLFVVTADGVEIPCLPGPAPSAAPADAVVLAYGTATSFHGFTCSSDPSGILCRHDASGHGFTIARAGYGTR